MFPVTTILNERLGDLLLAETQTNCEFPACRRSSLEYATCSQGRSTSSCLLERRERVACLNSLPAPRYDAHPETGVENNSTPSMSIFPEMAQRIVRPTYRSTLSSIQMLPLVCAMGNTRRPLFNEGSTAAMLFGTMKVGVSNEVT